MEQPNEVIILGAGGLGREMAVLCRRVGLTVKGFADDDATLGFVDGLPVLGNMAWLHEQTPRQQLVLGIGTPALRAKWMRSFAAVGWTFPALVDPGARLHDPNTISLGAGTVVTDGCILTTRVHLGQGVLVNLACTLGHDVTMDSFSALMPGVHVSGKVSMAAEVMVGTGAMILPGLSIGSGARVGAGAVVTHNIPSGETWTGVPAKPLS